MKRIAFYGGSFDPPHKGHLTIAQKLIELFALDEFVFIPAFHAPHKLNRKPTSAFHRYAMLALATAERNEMRVSKIELDQPEKPFTIETQTKLKRRLKTAKLFFVIGADSWQEIDTWKDWQKVLTMTNIIVVTRPGSEITFTHVTEKIKERIVDLRNSRESKTKDQRPKNEDQKIYITDAVNLDISSTDIRQKIRRTEAEWKRLVSGAVAKYIEKYEIYI